jgi:hypothetical protein
VGTRSLADTIALLGPVREADATVQNYCSSGRKATLATVSSTMRERNDGVIINQTLKSHAGSF